MQAVKQPAASLSSPPADTIPAGGDTSLSSLLGGIVNDLQELLADHLQLMKLEVQEDFQKSKDAMLPMVVGGCLMLAAFMLLIEMLIGWLTWMEPSIPWFGWAGIVALIAGAIAGALLLFARRKWQLVHPLPERTLRTVKKTIQSINDQVNTDKP
jgi:uncharacterized membrane protein YqjE